jgi:YbbR domain-containing protein
VIPVKKTYGFIFCFTAIVLFLTACQSNEQKITEATNAIDEGLNDKAMEQELPESKEDIAFEVEIKHYTDSLSVINILMQNNSNNFVIYGRQFSIEKNVDGIWYFVPFEDDLKMFQDDAPTVGAQETISEEIDLTQLKDDLSSGNYRVTRTFSKVISSDESEAETRYKDFKLAAPFKIKN